ETRGPLLAGLVVGGAALGRDGEPGRDGKPGLCHRHEAVRFAAEQFLRRVVVGNPRSEEPDEVELGRQRQSAHFFACVGALPISTRRRFVVPPQSVSPRMTGWPATEPMWSSSLKFHIHSDAERSKAPIRFSPATMITSPDREGAPASAPIGSGSRTLPSDVRKSAIFSSAVATAHQSVEATT